jgi:hypothetical protein
MAKKLGTITIEGPGGRPITYHLFDDGRATCRHVADGTPSASSGKGVVIDPKGRFGRREFAIHRCAACYAIERAKKN